MANKTILDNNNNILVLGFSCSLDFPSRYNENCHDPFIAKLDGNTGKLLWVHGQYNNRILDYTSIIDINSSYIVFGQMTRKGFTQWDPLNFFIMAIDHNGNFIKLKEFNLGIKIRDAILFPDYSLLLIGNQILQIDQSWDIIWSKNINISYYFWNNTTAQMYFLSQSNDKLVIGSLFLNGTLDWSKELDSLYNEYPLSIFEISNQLLIGTCSTYNISPDLKTIFVSLQGAVTNTSIITGKNVNDCTDIYYLTNSSGYLLYYYYDYPNTSGTYFATFITYNKTINYLFVPDVNGNTKLILGLENDIYFSSNVENNIFNKYVQSNNGYYKGNYDILVLKISNKNNSIIWAQYVGGKSYDYSYGIIEIPNVVFIATIVFISTETVYSTKSSKSKFSNEMKLHH